MDPQAIADIFDSFAKVRLRRMFSGQGIYAGDLFFAMEIGGEIFLKADAETEGEFAEAGSTRFTYERAGKTASIGLWRMPDVAFDDPEELTRWCSLAVAAARRAAARKRQSVSRQQGAGVRRPDAAQKAGRARSRSR